MIRYRVVLALLAVFLIAVCGCAHSPKCPEGGVGCLVIQADPDDALVFIDGMKIGMARDFCSKDKGYPLMGGVKVNVRVEREGYKPYKTEIELERQVQVLQVKLTKN